MRVAEAVVVDDFSNFNLVGAVDGLRELVVVDEHQAGAHGLEDIRLREHADQAGGLVNDMVDQRIGLDDAPADDAELLLRAETGGIALDEAADERGGAHGPSRGGAVRVGVGDRNFSVLGEGEGLRLHAVAAGDDDEAHAHADGPAMHIIAVAHDDDTLVVGDTFHGRGLAEGLEFHGGDAHIEFIDCGLVEGDDFGPADGADDGVNRAVHLAHRGRALGLGDEVVAEAEDGDVAVETTFTVEDGQGTDVVQVEELEGARAGVVNRDDIRVALHDIFDARGDVADEFRQRGAEAV